MGETDIRRDMIVGGLIGAIVGIGFLGGITKSISSDIEKAKIFQRGEKPAAMRLYRVGRDGILVENPQTKEYDITLNQHLGKIPNEADRRIEEAEIYKAVRWYEE